MSDDLAALSAAATPGRWSVGHPPATQDGLFSESPRYDENGEPSYLIAWCHGDTADEDAAFIAAAVNYVRGVLAGTSET